MRFIVWVPMACCILCSLATVRAQDIGSPSEVDNIDDGAGQDDTSPDRPIVSGQTGPGDEDTPIFALDARCIDMHACLKVHSIRGKTCHADDSLALQITNACKKPVALGVCIEQSDHTWDCGVQTKLAVGKSEKRAFINCHSTGVFHVLASTASDQAKGQCFSGLKAMAIPVNPVPGAFLGVCARVKACCRALQSLPGADAMAQACDALDALPDDVGVEACGQILSVMRREAAKVSGTPTICR